MYGVCGRRGGAGSEITSALVKHCPIWPMWHGTWRSSAVYPLCDSTQVWSNLEASFVVASVGLIQCGRTDMHPYGRLHLQAFVLAAALLGEWKAFITATQRSC